jgi:hypothetical protein
MYAIVLCVIVVSLPPGINPLAVINNIYIVVTRSLKAAVLPYLLLRSPSPQKKMKLVLDQGSTNFGKKSKMHVTG